MALSVENVQVWIWSICFIGTHTWWGDSASMEHFKYLMWKGSQQEWMLYLKQRGCKCVEVYYVHWVSQVQCLCSVCEQHAVYINEHLC